MWRLRCETQPCGPHGGGVGPRPRAAGRGPRGPRAAAGGRGALGFRPLRTPLSVLVARTALYFIDFSLESNPLHGVPRRGTRVGPHFVASPQMQGGKGLFRGTRDNRPENGGAGGGMFVQQLYSTARVQVSLLRASWAPGPLRCEFFSAAALPGRYTVGPVGMETSSMYPSPPFPTRRPPSSCPSTQPSPPAPNSAKNAVPPVPSLCHLPRVSRRSKAVGGQPPR